MTLNLIRVEGNNSRSYKCKIFNNQDPVKMEKEFQEWICDNVSFNILHMEYKCTRVSISIMNHSIFVFYKETY